MLSFVKAKYRFFRSVFHGINDPEFRGLLFFVTIILGIGTIFYRYAEQWTWINSFYFSAVTLTTVGYGDLSPATDIGKLFTVFYLFLGIGGIVAFINVIAKHAQTLDPLDPTSKGK